jgi:AraC-like DNA-binding protein
MTNTHHNNIMVAPNITSDATAAIKKTHANIEFPTRHNILTLSQSQFHAVIKSDSTFSVPQYILIGRLAQSCRQHERPTEKDKIENVSGECELSNWYHCIARRVEEGYDSQ